MEQKFMKQALTLAKKAYSLGDVPVGAVIVKDGVVVARGYNQKTHLNDATKHAEIIAISRASKKMHDFRLDGCDMYVTFEPCMMCLGAILSSRISNVYFGAFDRRFESVKYISQMPFNHSANIVGGVMEKECSELLTKFFMELRKNANTNTSS